MPPRPARITAAFPRRIPPPILTPAMITMGSAQQSAARAMVSSDPLTSFSECLTVVSRSRRFEQTRCDRVRASSEPSCLSLRARDPPVAGRARLQA